MENYTTHFELIDDGLVMLRDSIEGKREDIGPDSYQAWLGHLERIREALRVINES